MKTYQALCTSILMGTIIIASGCDNNKEPDTISNGSSKKISAELSNQGEIEKYNMYVDTANHLSGGFKKTLNSYLNLLEPTLQGNRPLTNYFVADEYAISLVKQGLGKALKKSVKIPEIDAPAKAFLESVEALEPLNHELSNYASTKGYLADNGEKARKLSPQFVLALEKVADAEEAFFSGIGKRDQALAKNNFESAEKDSLAYYEAGLVYYGKANIAASEAMLAAPGKSAELELFSKSLDRLAAMAEGWDKITHERQSSACRAQLMNINGLVSKARELQVQMQPDAVAEQAKRVAAMPERMRDSGIATQNMDFLLRAYRQNFTNMINGFNRHSC